MKKLLTIVAACAIAVPLMAPQAQAQVQFMPYIGYDFDMGIVDSGSFLVGVGAEFPLVPLAAFTIALRPSAEYYFVETDADISADFFQINADAIAELMPLGPGVGLFAGAGLGVGFWSVEGESSSDFGVNFLGGIDVDTGFLSPFIQARLTLMDGTRFGIQGGVKFGL